MTAYFVAALAIWKTIFPRIFVKVYRREIILFFGLLLLGNNNLYRGDARSKQLNTSCLRTAVARQPPTNQESQLQEGTEAATKIVHQGHSKGQKNKEEFV